MSEQIASDRRAKQESAWRDLMIRSQSGDKDAYHELLHSITPKIRAACGRSLGRANLCDDCMQEILLTIHRVLATYDPTRAFLPWLNAVIRNKVIDLVRKRYRQIESEILFDLVPEPLPEHDSSEHTEVDLAGLISELPEKYRLPLELTKLQGKTVKEAAKELSLSESALKVRVHRGIHKIKTSITLGISTEDEHV